MKQVTSKNTVNCVRVISCNGILGKKG